MKATGIVRRIDDLGRVVIPKEIRRTMRIREGDPLEIFTDKDGEVIFKKYSPMNELSDFAVQMCDTLGKTSGYPTAITDRDNIIAVCGAPKRDLLGKQISGELEGVMNGRQIFQYQPGGQRVVLSGSTDKYSALIAAPVLTEGDVMGCVIFFGEEDKATTETEYKLAQTVAGFLGKQMEN